MHRIKRLLLIFLILCGLSGVFVTTFIMAGTASAVSRSGPNPNPTCNGMGDCCSGEFCCWLQGQTPPSCATPSTQSTPVTQPQQGFVYNEGLKAGKKAGENDPAGASGRCPKDDPVYCAGWEEGYKEAQKAKEQESGQGQSGPSFQNMLPTILKGVVIILAVGIIVWMGAALAGITVTELAATAVKVVARFFGGNKP